MELAQLNDHNKKEYPPMHTAEHILNQTMVRKYGCGRSMNTHIEKKKSKCDYELDREPTEAEILEIENSVNEAISRNMLIKIEFMSIDNASKIVDLRKLPDNVSDTLRIVHVGEYDSCACIGDHVNNTSEIGRFKIISNTFENKRWRIRFKLQDN